MGLYNLHRFIIYFLGLIFLAGCNPSAKINARPLPDLNLHKEKYSFKGSVLKKKELKGKTKESMPSWWKEFHRPVLDEMVEEAFKANQDLKQAMARVSQARAIAVSTGSSYFPEVFIEGFSQANVKKGKKKRGNSSLGGTAQWEIDAFGRIGAALKSKQLNVVARKEDVAALRLSLSSEVAIAYFGAVGSNQTLELLNKQLKLDKKLLKLFKMRLTGGIGTNVELLQQEGRVADSSSFIPLAQASLRVFENRLDVLLGKMPDAKLRVPSNDNLKFVEKMHYLGIPSDLLLSRPDLRSLRTDLVSADASIEEAIAARMPRITLDGTHIFSDSATFVGPLSLLSASFVEPLLDWGKRRAEVSKNKALYKEKLALFTQTYLRAVEEVENNFYQEKKQKEFLKKLEKRRNILQKTVDNTRWRYDQGLDDYLPVISALQELRNVERRLIIEKIKLINFRINLYIAIGGNVAKG